MVQINSHYIRESAKHSKVMKGAILIIRKALELPSFDGHQTVDIVW